MSRFTKILTVSPLADGRHWFLREEFGYDVGAEGSEDTVNVPEGFMTDFASVPRPLWWLFPRWGRYGNAAVIHDFCYWDQRRIRKEADGILFEAMGVLAVGTITRYLLYWCVRFFGGWAWWMASRRKRAGCIKIAIRPPAKSIDTWKELVEPIVSDEDKIEGGNS